MTHEEGRQPAADGNNGRSELTERRKQQAEKRTHEDKRQPGVNDKFRDMIESEMRQTEKDLKVLQGKAERMIAKVKDTTTSFRATADTLDKMYISARIFGGVLTITGGIASMVKSGEVNPLAVAGIGVLAVTGAMSNFGTSYVQDLIIWNELRKAEKDLKETIECINDVNNTVQSWDNGSVKGKLPYLRFHPMQTLDLTDPVVRILQNALSSKFVERMETKALQIGEQAALCNSSKFEDKKTTGANIVTGVWDIITSPLRKDVIRMGFKFRDEVEQQSSKAANILRQTADELEKLC